MPTSMGVKRSIPIGHRRLLKYVGVNGLRVALYSGPVIVILTLSVRATEYRWRPFCEVVRVRSGLYREECLHSFEEGLQGGGGSIISRKYSGVCGAVHVHGSLMHQK